MKNKTLERIVWVLIYAGLFTASLGAFLHDASTLAASLLIGLGLTAAVIGVLLIFVRAKRPD